MVEYDEIDRLKELLEDTGLSVTKFAAKAGVNQSNLSATLNRKRNLGNNVLIKIAEAFDVNPRWITTGQGRKYKNEENVNNNLLAESSQEYRKQVDYKGKYINELEDQVKYLKELNKNMQKELIQKSEIIQGFIDGSISKIEKIQKE